MNRTLAAAAAAGILTIGASMATPIAAAEAPPCDVERWEPAIAKFEKRDAAEPPPKDAVLFVGSSSIVGWNVKKWFPDLPVINRGFGGSQFCQAAHFVPRIVTKYKPRAIVLYSGDNDVAAGKSPEQVHADFAAFVAAVRKDLPKTQILVVAIKPSIARWKLREPMQAANRLIAADCEKDGHLHFIDIWPSMLGEDGLPRKELFKDDGLHLKEEGYKLWVEQVRPKLDELLKTSSK